MYIYHQTPRQFIGWDIRPLNQIKSFDRVLYEQYLQKYKGREHLIKDTIPLLNCGWGDVIFLTAVSPQMWRSVFDTIGHKVSRADYFQIPLAKLDLDSTVVMNYNAHEEETFSWFYPRNVKKIRYIPDKARNYFKEIYATGEFPFWHHLVPQILYRGTLNISGCPTITA